MPEMESLVRFIENHGYAAIFATMFAEGLCITMPSELVLGFAGFFVFQGSLEFWPAVAAGWLGSMAGSAMVYAAARKGGRRLVERHGHRIRLSADRLDRMSRWFGRYGPPLIIPWRQIPVLRPKISIAAGILGMPPAAFLTFSAIGIAIWCLLATGAGLYLGRTWPALAGGVLAAGPAFAAVVAAVAAAAGCILWRRRRKEEI